jgi:transposase
VMPRGQTAKTPERVAEAQRLYDSGLFHREIAERMGVARSTVAAWIDDPNLDKQRARRLRYGRECVDCGAPTDGSRGYETAAVRCKECRLEFQTKWDRESVIAAIQRWADEDGGIPPSQIDWNPSHPQGSPAQTDRYQAADYCPDHTTVARLFGTWNEGIRAAGFTPRPTPQRGTEPILRVVRAFRAGESIAEIAEREGVGPGAIRMRLRRGRERGIAA